MRYTASELHLDYFQIYDIENQGCEERIKARGQFDKIDKLYQLVKLDCFANPVMKNQEPLYNKQAHLAFYRMYTTLREDNHKVEVVNQFGVQKLLIGKVVGLLAPAQKIEKGSALPTKLSHFAVYNVLEWNSVGRRVQLQDQFGASSAVRVGIPKMFAVPIKKIHGRLVFPIVNAKVHLVIYMINPKNIEKNCTITDQIKKNRRIKVTQRLYLAAPTIKRRWSVA
jgi:hypothetical protein